MSKVILIQLNFISWIVLSLFISDIDCVKTISISIKEEQKIGSRIGNIKSHMSDIIQSNKELKFVKLTSKNHDYIDIERNSGVITIKRRIDKETICPKQAYCKLEIQIHCNNGANFFNMIQLIIKIIDINDNKCSFVKSDKQKVTWIEDSRKFDTKESLNRPEDLDTSYSILKSEIKLIESHGKFRLDIQESSSLTRPFNLELTLIGDLDYEHKKQYNLVIEAGDGNSKCQLDLTVDVKDFNDNNPKFSSDSYQILLKEDQQVNQTFFQVKADDKDEGDNAKIFYEIDHYADNDIQQKFGIKRNGWMYLKKKLNFHENKLYKIPVIARNINMHARFDTSQVVITVTDVNNHAPDISVKSVLTGTSDISIKEEEMPGMDVGMVIVTDKDDGKNAQVHCEIIDQSLPNALELRETNSNKQYRLVTNRKVDREKINLITITIKCVDSGDVPKKSVKLVRIKILDINDNAPRFHPINLPIQITEDSDPYRRKNDYIIHKFTAMDSDHGVNRKLRYSLIFPHGVGQDVIKIDSKSGILRSNGQLDRETTPFISFIVVAKDSGNPPLSGSTNVNCTVKDYNDERPEFSIEDDYTIMMNENNNVSAIVGQVYARDRDIGINSNLNFKVETGDTDFPFEIYSQRLNKDNRRRLSHNLDFAYVIDIYAVKSIDRDQLNHFVSDKQVGYEFLLRAIDSGVPQLVKRVKIRIIVLDSNDNTPYFTFPNFNSSFTAVSYRQHKGYQIGRVDAIDPDYGINGTIYYRLRPVSSRRGQPIQQITSIFDLNPDTGYLSLARDLTYSDIGVYPIIITASDRAEPKQLRKTATQSWTIEIDNSATVYQMGNGYGKSGTRLGSFLGNLFGDNQDGQTINLYIIVAIVIGSFIISVIMLAAICVVLKKSRRQRNRLQGQHSSMKNENSCNSNQPLNKDNQHLSNSESLLALSLSRQHSIHSSSNGGRQSVPPNLAVTHQGMFYDSVPHFDGTALMMKQHTTNLPQNSSASSVTLLKHQHPVGSLSSEQLASVGMINQDTGMTQGFLPEIAINTSSMNNINCSILGQPPPIIQPFNTSNQQALMPQHQNEKELQNSTDLDSGKGDSVEVSTYPNSIYTFPHSSTNNFHTKLSSHPHHHHHHHIFQPFYQTSIPNVTPKLCTISSSQFDNNTTQSTTDNILNKDIYGYFRAPRFFHLSTLPDGSNNNSNNNNDNNETNDRDNKPSKELNPNLPDFVLSNNDEIYNTSYI